MRRRAPITSQPQGHPLGGLFVSRLAVVLVPLLYACAGVSSGPAVPASPGPDIERTPNPLGAYRQLGYIVGDPGFAAVGRFAYLPGPADSVYVVFGLSLPNTALRFRRDPPGFIARYRVAVTISDQLGPSASFDVTEEVRVRAFRETSRRDESVVYQAFLKLIPGTYQARIEVRDLGSAHGFTAEAELAVPEFGLPSITAPIVAYRVEPRVNRKRQPTLIISPRATVEVGISQPTIYVEGLVGTREEKPVAVLDVLDKGELLWTDTLSLQPVGNALHVAIDSIDLGQLPPGGLTLRARFLGTQVAASGPLLVALLPDWLFVEYTDVINYLRYAGTQVELDSLRQAPPGERARRLHAFWSRRDSVPETPENEFFAAYFRRIQEANDRFSEPALAGWLTARGEVYVTLGPPDEVLRQLETERQTRTQVWFYNESLAFELRLVFFDETGLGSFRLTPDSRRAFREAVQHLHS